jgi:beta-galactosidase/beta-glucuronidase
MVSEEKMYRKEYPRPNFARENWQNLNGVWEFAFDDNNVGHRDKWYAGHDFDLKIVVPFCFQSELSMINDTGFHDHVWYRRKFKVEERDRNKRIILHVGACDYESEVYINGQLVKRHVGGHSSFSADITDYLTYGEEEIVIYAFDPSTDEFIPRGKQYWKEKNEGIWYPRTTGIWQTVWLEAVDRYRLEDVRMTPDVDNGNLDLDITLSEAGDYILEILVFDRGKILIKNDYRLQGDNLKTVLKIFNGGIMERGVHNPGKLWSPENPYLFDIHFRLCCDGREVDFVKSYFGMRKIHAEGGAIFLNNRPYYQKLVLDQGYWEKGLLTAPSDDDFVNDITLAKRMGFNGCRRHQVVSDPRFLYHADRLGFIVWGEMANSANYNFKYVERMVTEWMRVVKRDYNHPSILVWVPLNESWGVPAIATSRLEQHHSLSLYHLTRSLDDSRLVVSNDGWEMTKTDICSVHNYNHGGENEPEKQAAYAASLLDKESILSSMPAGRSIYVPGYRHEGGPIMLTEFGGIAFAKDQNGWGYTTVKDEDTFLREYTRLLAAIGKSKSICGFCYTQLTDVFQEKNGLLTFDRRPKVAPEKIKQINDALPLIPRLSNGGN